MGKKHRRHHPAEQRREQFVAPPQKRSNGLSPMHLILGAGFLLLAAVLWISRTGGTAAPVATGAAGGDVAFALSEFDDGVARFYRHTTASGREIRFFVMKSADGVVRAAFDACDVCFRERRGYRQSGDVMVCNNCGQTFRSVDINVLQGGCNPAPIDRQVQGDRLVLAAASLEQGAAYF